MPTKEQQRQLMQTETIERWFDLSDRFVAVKTFIHAFDYLYKEYGNVRIDILQACSIIADGIKNAIDGRSTGYEWRVIRHSYKLDRDGPEPPEVALEDRRCERCGAVRPRPFTHCFEHNAEHRPNQHESV